MTTKPSDEPDAGGAVNDPAGYYNDPSAIAADRTLSQAQKRRFLDEWRADLADSSDADPKVAQDVSDARAAMASTALPPDDKTLRKR